MKRIILSIWAVVFTVAVFAQQNFQVSQYYKASNLINPAFSGVNTNLELGVGFRKQWTGFDQSPTTFYVAGHQGIQKTDTTSSISAPLHLSNTSKAKIIKSESEETGNKHGIGGYAYSDKFGYLSRTAIGVSYAMHFEVSDDLTFSGGASAGISSFKLDYNALTIREEADPFFGTLGTSTNQRLSVDLSIGFLLYSKNFYVGYSGGQLLGNKIYASNLTDKSKLKLNHNVMAGFKYMLEGDLYVMTSALFKLQGVGSAKVDFDVKVANENKFWGGLGFRNQDALVIFLGGQVADNINLNYSYDLNSRISQYTSGGHEIVLGISLGDNVGSKDQYYW